jgi:hypothetical protein
VLIYRRAHGWVQDWWITNERWCERHFMFHGWKKNEIGHEGWQSPFTTVPAGADCIAGNAWPWRPNTRQSCQFIHTMVADSERQMQKGYPKAAYVLPYLHLPDVGKCWPDCPH